MKNSFIDLLHAAAGVLAKFAETSASGGLIWSGTAYVQSSNAKFDPYAAKWWSILTAVAGLLDAQDTPLSPRQREYLSRLLFGGMGSFNDFALDESWLGSEAVRANRELDRLRKEMFEQFRHA